MLTGWLTAVGSVGEQMALRCRVNTGIRQLKDTHYKVIRWKHCADKDYNPCDRAQAGPSFH
jgi:hypothetical protein